MNIKTNCTKENSSKVIPSSFDFRITGDSMLSQEEAYHSFPDGSYLRIDQQQAAESGDFVVAKVSGVEGFFFRQLQLDSEPCLASRNSDYPNITDEFKVIGKVVEAGFSL